MAAGELADPLAACRQPLDDDESRGGHAEVGEPGGQGRAYRSFRERVGEEETLVPVVAHAVDRERPGRVVLDHEGALDLRQLVGVVPRRLCTSRVGHDRDDPALRGRPDDFPEMERRRTTDDEHPVAAPHVECLDRPVPDLRGRPHPLLDGAADPFGEPAVSRGAEAQDLVGLVWDGELELQLAVARYPHGDIGLVALV